MRLETLLYDLEFWLVAATLLCGIIWFFYWLSNRNKQALVTEDDDNKEPIIVEYAKAFFPVLLLVVFLRSFIAEPFRIPSGSMMPTLEVGDFILVNKFAYGIRLPVLRTKLIDTELPKRGDVFVFRFPDRPWQNFIKRVIGLPGDTIRWDGNKLYVNDQLVPNQKTGQYEAIDQFGGSAFSTLHKEKLGDVEHDIIFTQNRVQSMYMRGEKKVPEGHYFAVGDNRFGSHDSRAWGFVPETHLVGKALFVWMHYSGNNKGFDLSRIGTPIK